MKAGKMSGAVLLLTLLACSNARTLDLPSDNGLGDPPGQFTISPEQDSVTLPLEYLGMNLMIDAKMNGVDIKMLIDNGVMWDELLFFGSEQVDQLGMKHEGTVNVDGAGDDRDVGTMSHTASGVSLSFGDITFTDQEAVITPRGSAWENYFPGAAGQVCGALFKHFVVEFDFDRDQLILHRPDTYEHMNGGSRLRMTRTEFGSYEVPLEVTTPDGTIRELDLSIDLGGIFPLSVVIGEESGVTKPDTPKVYLAHGASGEINGYIDRFSAVRLGGYELPNVPFASTEGNGDHTNMIIGLPLLMRFNLVFDYNNGVLYLKPNSRFSNPFEERMVP